MKAIRLLTFLFLLNTLNSCCTKWCPSMAETRDKHSNNELNILYENSVDNYTRPLNLDDLIAMALEQNLDIMVKAFEYEIQRELVTGERLRMLPNLLYDWEWSFRNKNTGASSESLVPGIPPAPPSISSTRTRRTDDLLLVWNFLDFGLAYYRSKQEANKALILCFEYERLRQNLVLDVTKQYWKAIVARHAVKKGRELIEQAKKQIAVYERQMANGLLPYLIGLTSISDTFKIELEIQLYEKEYHSAMANLYLLVAVPPNCHFELAEPSLDFTPDICQIDMNEFVKSALMNRPEMFGGDVKETVMDEEMQISLLQMLPGLQYCAGTYEDLNKFLIFNNWLQHGVRVIGNLMSIPRQYQNFKSAKWQKELARQNRLSLAMGIITQLYLAYFAYIDNKETFRISSDLNNANKRLFAIGIKERDLGKLHDAALLKIAADELFTEIDAWKAYAEMQVSIEQINNTLGLPRYIFCEESFKDHSELENEPSLEGGLVNLIDQT